MKHRNLVNDVLENQLIDDFGPKFREFVSRVGGTVQTIQKEPARPGPDLLLQAEIRGTPITLIAEAKSVGEPRYVRQAADQLRDYAARFPGAYPIVVSSFISPQTAEMLRSATPPDLVARYVDALDAPRGKSLVWFEASAHMPHYEEPARFRLALLGALNIVPNAAAG